MKAITTVASAFAATMLLCVPAAAQNNNNTRPASVKVVGQTAPVSTPADTVSLKDFSLYMGVAQTTGLKSYIATRMNVDTTKMDDFMRGVNEMLKKPDDKKLAAYAAGVQIGQQLMQQILPNVNQRITDKAGTKFIDEDQFKKGVVAGITGKGLTVSTDSAMKIVQNQMEFYNNRLMEQKYGKNREEGEKFLAENAKKEGVKTLPSGVQYKVIKEGTGAMPAVTSKVKVHYEGRTIEGKVFDSSYKRGEPVEMRCNQMIKGWTDALTHMPAGSVWEVYIPQQLAYGERGAGEIKPFSALVFKIELLEIVK